jgi:hypothetical protein
MPWKDPLGLRQHTDFFQEHSAKIIKCSKSIIAPQITSILNMSIDQSVFPDKLKIFEKILEQQLSDFFENIFNPYLCAFRRGHGCQTTLLRLLEDWRDKVLSSA